MHDSVSLILAIFGALLTWTATVATLTFWLAGRFRYLEQLIYREQHKLDLKYAEIFKEQRDRITVIELKVLGVSGVSNHNPVKPSRY